MSAAAVPFNPNPDDWSPVAQALRRAALAVAQPGGPTLFDELVHELAASLDVAAVFIAVFDDEARTRLRTLAALLDGRALRNFDYPLAGSPCAQVVGREFRYVASGVYREYPADTIFGAKGMDSYAAFPLADSDGAPLGLLVAMNRTPIADPVLAEAMLKIFASRIAAEIERSRGDAALRAAALAVSSARGASVFAELVRYLATILRVEMAFIARHDAGDPDDLRIIALYHDGEILQDICYPIENTPCATVLGQRFRAYPSRLRALFPEDDDVLADGMESYAGYPLADLDGKPLGIISIGSRQPMAHVERVESMLQIFAVRAAAEIERQRADEALHRSEASYRAIFDAAEDAIYIHDWNSGALVDVNPKACRTSGYSREEMIGQPVAVIATSEAPYTSADAMRHIELAKLGRCPPFEWRRRNKDGSLRWDEVGLKPATINGKPYVVAFTHEITERKAAEQALKLREEQYRAIFEASSDAFVLRDAQQRIVDVNPAFLRTSGFTREHLATDSGYPAHFPREYIEQRRELVRRALAGEESHLETTLLRADGTSFEADLRVIPVRYGGQPHVLSVVRDITERKQAEAALKLREEQYRVIFEAASDSFILRDAQMRVVDVNPAFVRMSGFTREHLESETGYPQDFPPAHVAERHALVRRGLAGETIELEMRLLRADGSAFDAEVRVMPVRHRGQPHVLSIVRDITERKAAERALQLREQQYRAIFDGASDAMALWSRDLRIVDVNRAFTPMFGYTREESIGAVFGERLTRDEVERRKVLVERALAGHEAQIETESVRRNGERFDVELRYLPIQHRGEPHVLAVMRDITARRRAEAERTDLESQLRQAQKMEAIGHLTGGIAHDFNNILTSVIGYVVLAGERAEGFGDAKLSRQLEQAHVAAQRARDLIAQMLTFARRQRGARAVLALPALVRQTVQLLRATLPSSIDLDAETDDAAPAVEADAVQIEQVLFNLCINARDAIDGASGHIRVRLRGARGASWHCASCRARIDGGARWVELSVSDSGSGIAPEVLDRMFDPFYTTKEVGRGSGMGLAMVHGIVHDHGGHLRVETTPGRGSVFRVLLPPAQQAAAVPAAPKSAAAAPRERLHGRVLIVEDQAMVSEFMGELLDGWGLDVALQRDPLLALRTLEDATQPLDLLITDQTMPHLTGLELARRAVAARPRLPVLLYTGNAGEFDPAELQRCGVHALLRKPIVADELRTLLRRLLGGDTAR